MMKLKSLSCNKASSQFEPGLEAMVKENQSAGRLRFTSDVKEAVDHGLFQFIAVGTPPDEDGSADLQYVLAVKKHCRIWKITVLLSTNRQFLVLLIRSKPCSRY
jgi:UDP-glucose 6-dehydrogenase